VGDVDGQLCAAGALTMKHIRRFKPQTEFTTAERCAIVELLNDDEYRACSIARARVAPGTSTRRHALRGTIEHYVILEGRGEVEIGGAAAAVAPLDVVSIPAGTPQRITNIGEIDLVFLCVCTPRFELGAYEERE